ncbi:hypothetical protein I316_06832 [Kwoniella heveanensis BCC8398]|uniref:Major facilitator superfamily (MFS) profile domain-containing protein n=1 Tax=Kwoniella heveanensis BCC8398 TaxID=1296120 RepID=A0A1B9GK06_9TREE|nr:hypothetical protein I316_06832 [Kwoniella heveanensis BCC8398]
MAGAVGGLVNKKLMANTPKEVINWRLFAMALILSFAGGLHGYNTANISGVLSMTDFVKTFGFEHYTTTELANIKGWITSVLVLGGCFGTLSAQFSSEWLGRRASLFIAAAGLLIGSILQVANHGSVGQFIAGRAIAGVGCGFGTVVGPMYISEIAPAAIRGGLASMFNMNIMTGVCLGYWINYGSIVNIADTNPWQWRVPLIVQMLPGVILFVGLPFVPESPRWYVLKNRVDEATKAYTRITTLPADHPYVQKEIDALLVHVPRDETGKPVTDVMSYKDLGLLLYRDRTMLRRVVIAFLFQVFFNFSGGNSITYYQSNILTSIGLKGQRTAALFSSIYGFAKVVSIIIYAGFLVDRFGRRVTLMTGASIDIACLIYIAAYLGVADTSKSTGVAGWFAVVALCLFAIGYAMSWGTIPFGITAEVFPNRVRGKLMSMLFCVQYCVNFGLSRGFPNMVITMHSWGPFALFAIVTTLGTVYAFFALPETKGQNIELMDQLFDRSWYLNGVVKHNTVPVAHVVDEELGTHFEQDEKAVEENVEYPERKQNTAILNK